MLTAVSPAMNTSVTAGIQMQKAPSNILYVLLLMNILYMLFCLHYSENLNVQARINR